MDAHCPKPDPPARRTIEVNRKLVGPVTPRVRPTQRRRLTDYPRVSDAHKRIATALSHPMLLGPPICDELIALVEHVFDQEQAAVVRHLGALRGRRAGWVARRVGQPVARVREVLDAMALGRRIIARTGPDERPVYRLMPIVPGMFEMALIGEAEPLSPWHQRFAELFEALYETGYMAEYRASTAPVRAHPIYTVTADRASNDAVDSESRDVPIQQVAMPTDALAAVLDRYDTFGIGRCQCRLAARAVGQGCDGELENCLVMGSWARRGIDQGWLREVTRDEALAIKRRAEAAGMINWSMNVASVSGEASCSCCRCCCHALRAVSELGMPGMFAPPRFLPQFDFDRCTYCGRCARACPVAAIIVDPVERTHEFLRERCIGCGQCQVACGETAAVAMHPVERPAEPHGGWLSLMAASAPGMLRNLWHAWRTRG